MKKKIFFIFSALFLFLAGMSFVHAEEPAPLTTVEINSEAPALLGSESASTGSSETAEESQSESSSKKASKVTEQKVKFVLFHSDTCPHCKKELQFIEKELKKDSTYKRFVEFEDYEVSSKVNQQRFAQYASMFGTSAATVPMTFIGSNVISGFGSADTTGEEIKRALDAEIARLGLTETSEEELEALLKSKNTDAKNIHIPFFGSLDVSNFSLPVLTVVLGTADGFNPCAMWVLLFLISLLLGMENRRRMWILGSLFILSSGLVYFAFMAAWLKLISFLRVIYAAQVLIGLAAVSIGAWNVKDYWKNRKNEGVTCKVSNKKGAKNTFEKIKDIVHKKSLALSIVGILLLGFSVNLVELLCSAGFPAVFTNVLDLSGISMGQKYLYMAGYILFYMIDDIIVFSIAMFTMKTKTLGGKYAKYANLIGGLLILILGLLLIFKPDYLQLAF